jgi:hypothetical protein
MTAAKPLARTAERTASAATILVAGAGRWISPSMVVLGMLSHGLLRVPAIA